MTTQEKEEEYSRKAVNMLIAIQCLPFAMYDIEDELGDRFKHQLKKRFKISQSKIEKASEIAWKVFHYIDCTNVKGIANNYVLTAQNVYNHIDKNVELDKDKYINIFVALIRIINIYNNNLPKRYEFEPVQDIKNLPHYLDIIPIDDKTIIELSYKIEHILDKRDELEMTVNI